MSRNIHRRLARRLYRQSLGIRTKKVNGAIVIKRFCPSLEISRGRGCEISRLGIGFALFAVAWFAVTRIQAAANPSWQAGTGFRFAALAVPTNGQTGFTLLKSSETGITFSNRLSDVAVASNRLYEIGSGVALGDVDGDGWVDIYFCRLEGDNVLYRNLGNWRFEEITASAGVTCPNQFSTGCVLADLDGDRDLDLLVNSLGGGTRSFLNDGRGHFTEMTDSLLLRRFGATSMALADVDGDGDLDLYVTNYRTDTFFDNPPGLKIGQRRQPDGSIIAEPTNRFLTLPGPTGGLQILEKGEPDFLYLNRGNGRFSPARWDAGVFIDEDNRPLTDPTTDWGLSVLFRDLNGDGLPDLYICNDFVNWPDRIWLNQESKRFRAAPRLAFRNTSLSSMAVDVADINRDGFDDIFVVDMLSQRRESRARQRPDMLEGIVKWPVQDPNFRPEVARNTLHLARGDGTYAEIGQLAGVSATDWAWGVAFVDVDLDGWEDLLVATGANHDVQDADAMEEISRSGGWGTPEMRLSAFQKLPRRETPAVALRNRHDLTFEDASKSWGFDEVGIAHGMALADLDGDGDLDVVLNCLNAPARLYRNTTPAPRFAIQLKGVAGNTRGVGAKLKLRGRPVTQTQEMISGGRYLSGDNAMRVFAGEAGKPVEIEVTWRSGKRSLVADALPNHLYEIDEAAAMEVQSSEFKSNGAAVAPLFEDASRLIRHVNVESPFDDFARQPLLPRKLSTPGPGVAWADVNDDGFVDLLLSGGANGRTTIFRNDGRGGLAEWTDAPLPKINARDQTSVLAWQSADRIVRLVVGESNWEDTDTNAPPFRVFPLKSSASTSQVPGLLSQRSATGPMALADVDGDGDLDLFVGGRVVAGRYPEPADSELLGREGESFNTMQRFPKLGLVSGAVFLDLESDGDPDLALACEWDSIRIFRNDRGTLVDVTGALRLSPFKGRWNGIAAGDFDGDGRMDIVASNWGRNWRTDQPPGVEAPVQLFHGDFNGNGSVQTLLASLDPWLSKTTPWRERKAVIAAIPSVAARLTTHRSYGRASVQEVLAEKAVIARELNATTFDSMLFLNRGDRFEARPLPIEAQFAPAFGVSVADFDGDANEDVFLAQNFFGTDAETSRHDAGVGLVLLGDGHGGFRTLSPRASGIGIYGEQRASAVADFDGDGRMDLAVTQHSGPTKLFRNVRGLTGVSVVLRGSTDNPSAVGAAVRLKFEGSLGSAREIHAGSGYLSQDAAVLVLSTPAAPIALQVRWSGGQSQEWPWPAGAKSVEVSKDGIRAQ